jgi:hypothetical protein
MRKVFLGVVFSLIVIPLLGQECPIPVKTKTKIDDPVPLCLVAFKIKKALDDYNNDPTTQKDPALKLSKAEFDFKTVRSKNGGLKFSILVLNVGATRQVDSTDDVTFSYEVPSKSKSITDEGFLSESANPDFSKQLIDTIKEAANQLQTTKAIGEAKFKTLTINLAYGVKWDFAAGVTIPIQLVTIGGSFDRNKTSTQSVKLTFGQ